MKNGEIEFKSEHRERENENILSSKTGKDGSIIERQRNITMLSEKETGGERKFCEIGKYLTYICVSSLSESEVSIVAAEACMCEIKDIVFVLRYVKLYNLY